MIYYMKCARRDSIGSFKQCVAECSVHKCKSHKELPFYGNGILFILRSTAKGLLLYSACQPSLNLSVTLMTCLSLHKVFIRTISAPLSLLTFIALHLQTFLPLSPSQSSHSTITRLQPLSTFYPPPSLIHTPSPHPLHEYIHPITHTYGITNACNHCRRGHWWPHVGYNAGRCQHRLHHSRTVIVPKNSWQHHRPQCLCPSTLGTTRSLERYSKDRQTHRWLQHPTR